MPEGGSARKDGREPIAVTAAVIRRGDEVLVARRTAPDWLAGRWEFPGGKVEAGETPRAALARELWEELTLEVEVGEHLLTTTHAYPLLVVRLAAYEARWIAGEPRPREHDAVAWMSVAGLERLPLAPADLPIVSLLRAGSGAG